MKRRCDVPPVAPLPLWVCVQQALPRPPPPPPHGHRPGGGTEGLSARLGLAGAGIGEDG